MVHWEKEAKYMETGCNQDVVENTSRYVIIMYIINERKPLKTKVLYLYHYWLDMKQDRRTPLCILSL